MRSLILFFILPIYLFGQSSYCPMDGNYSTNQSSLLLVTNSCINNNNCDTLDNYFYKPYQDDGRDKINIRIKLNVIQTNSSDSSNFQDIVAHTDFIKGIIESAN